MSRDTCARCLETSQDAEGVGFEPTEPGGSTVSSSPVAVSLRMSESREILRDLRFHTDWFGSGDVSYRLVLRSPLTNPLTSETNRQTSSRQGHLAERGHLGMGDAFFGLHHHGRNHNVLVVDVAQSVIGGTLVPAPPRWRAAPQGSPQPPKAEVAAMPVTGRARCRPCLRTRSVDRRQWTGRRGLVSGCWAR
jgi:hypothetical protein